MSETAETSGGGSTRDRWFFDWLREGAEKASQAWGPPGPAAKHFREARLEILRGVRALIDHRIECLSKEDKKGSRVVVE
jgi:hypothetical protein